MDKRWQQRKSFSPGAGRPPGVFYKSVGISSVFTGPRPSEAPKGLRGGSSPKILWVALWPQDLGARTPQGGPSGRRLKIWVRRCEAWSIGFGVFPFKRKINVHCCASRCTGRARRGSIRPFSIGSSHCLTQYGCKS